MNIGKKIVSLALLVLGDFILITLINALNTQAINHRGVVIFIASHSIISILLIGFGLYVIGELFRKLSMRATLYGGEGWRCMIALLWPASLIIVASRVNFAYTSVFSQVTIALLIMGVEWIICAAFQIKKSRTLVKSRNLINKCKDIALDKIENENSMAELSMLSEEQFLAMFGRYVYEAVIKELETIDTDVCARFMYLDAKFQEKPGNKELRNVVTAYIFLVNAFSKKKPGADVSQEAVRMANHFDDLLLKTYHTFLKKSPESAEMIGNTEVTEQIRKFKALYDDGIITKEEFEAKKKSLLEM